MDLPQNGNHTTLQIHKYLADGFGGEVTPLGPEAEPPVVTGIMRQSSHKQEK